MVSLQIISKVLNTRSNEIIEDNLLTEDYFIGYESEFNFIQDHIKKYGNVPDKATFLAQFPNIELVEVAETDRYLVDTAKEELLYHKSVPVIQRAAELLKTNSNDAAEYMLNAVKELQPEYDLGGVSIVKSPEDRKAEFAMRGDKDNVSSFTCGFPELDDAMGGLQRGEELFVIFARTNQGKSWVLAKMCTHVWQIGYNVGYISPEMGANSIGFRFDTLNAHFSNKALMRGNTDEVNQDEYNEYLDNLEKHEGDFIVSTPKDFNKLITVSRIRNWAKKFKLDLIAIDGITYLTDERGKRSDNKTTSLTNISEDLMELSVELGVPVLVVVQANRSGVVDKDSTDTPELESIRDSDGIAHNASKVLSIQQKQPDTLTMILKKQRFGRVGDKFIYTWNINNGEFTYMPSYDDYNEPKERKEPQKRKYEDKSDMF